jgi:hypothetical protein
MIAAAQIKQMTLDERMEAMEVLWHFISTESGRVAWHPRISPKR